MKLKLIYEIDTTDPRFHHHQNLIEFVTDGYNKEDANSLDAYKHLFASTIEMLHEHVDPLFPDIEQYLDELRTHLLNIEE